MLGVGIITYHDWHRWAVLDTIFPQIGGIGLLLHLHRPSLLTKACWGYPPPPIPPRESHLCQEIVNARQTSVSGKWLFTRHPGADCYAQSVKYSQVLGHWKTYTKRCACSSHCNLRTAAAIFLPFFCVPEAVYRYNQITVCKVVCVLHLNDSPSPPPVAFNRRQY